MRPSKHIRRMNRAALEPLITTALVAIAGVLAWLFWIGDPCLGAAIANNWTARIPSDVAPPPASSTEFVVIENPYGIMTCHHWPTAAEQVLGVSLFVIIILAIGWLAALRVTQRPLLTAAAISALALLVAVVLLSWARWESAEVLLPIQLFAVLVLFLIAAGIAMFGAWITLRFTRRA